MIYAAAARDVVAHISCVYCNQCTNFGFGTRSYDSYDTLKCSPVYIMLE